MSKSKRFWLRGPAGILFLLGSLGCLRIELPEAKIMNGQGQPALTWERSVEMALTHHPDLLQARAELKSRKYNRNQAFGDLLPTATGNLVKTSGKNSAAGESQENLNLGVTVEQTLFKGFGNASSFLRAKREWEAEEWDYANSSSQVRLSVRTAFIDLIRSNELLKVADRIAKRRKSNAELINLRYEAGRENKGAMLRAKAISEQADFVVRATGRQIESKSLALGRNLGGTFWTPVSISETLDKMVPVPEAKPLDYPALAEQVPAVQRSIKSAEAVKASVVTAQSVIWPEVTGSYNYGGTGNTVSNTRDNSELALKVSVPFFNGGSNIEGVLEANADYKAALEAARSARDQAITDLSAAWNAFQDALEAVSVRKSFLEASRVRAEIVRSKYSSGLSTYQEFDIAEQEFADSENNYVNSLAEALTQAARWDAARGLTLEEAYDENKKS